MRLSRSGKTRRRGIARDISYAHSAQTRAGRTIIRTLENVTGRLKLIKRAKGFESELSEQQDFWEVMAKRYGLSLDMISGSLENIPETGPVILIANHPFGILDGLIMGLILSRARGDFRILANSVFQQAQGLNQAILPISFAPSKDALQSNIQTRKLALDYLGQGGAVGVFPGGAVSTANKPFGRPLDPSWGAFTARLITKSNAAVVPIYFDGRTSRMFQIASHVHPSLRLGLLIKEFRTKIDNPVRIAIGKSIAPEKLREHAKDPREMMDFLRRSTYELSQTPIDATQYGYEFDKARRKAG